MANYVITPSGSRTTQLADLDAAATLLVTEGAYIISVPAGIPAYYANGGGARVTVEGTVITYGGYGGLYIGANESSSVGGGNHVTITSTGYVEGNNGVSLFGGGNWLVNDGMLHGTGTTASSGIPDNVASGAYMLGGGSVTNSGSIIGYYGIFSAQGDTRVTNSGVITATAENGDAISSRSGQLAVNNSGTINGDIVSSGSILNTVHNTGTINGNVFVARAHVTNFGTITGGCSGNSGTDSIVNYGSIGYVSTFDGEDHVFNRAGGIIGSVDFGAGVDTLRDRFTNDGQVGSVSFNAGDDTLVNTGRVHGSVSFGDGSNRLENTGNIHGSVSVGTGNGADFVTNQGRIYGGLGLGGGNDFADNSAGVIDNWIDLGTGADGFLGGAAIDRVFGGFGNDAIDLSAHNDIYYASNNDGHDQIDGGEGIDTYNAVSATFALTVDLGSETSAGTVGNDGIIDFENAIGGRAGDRLIGSEAANRLDGYIGNDSLFGAGGGDRLIGGAGADVLNGGTGKDWMRGGTGADWFVFAGGDSGVTATTRDVILDFTDHGSATAPFAAGADIIDLRLIDARSNIVGDQAFSFNATDGAAFSGVSGSLVWRQLSGFALVSGDVNGDSKADFTIQLNGTHALFASDFLL